MSKNILPLITALVLVFTETLTGDASPTTREPLQPNATKIKFKLSHIRPDGLRGTPDGLVSVAYEFCVPANAQTYEEVKRIDPSVKIHTGSRGRIGYGKNQALCIGSTHQPRWHEVLKRLSSLPYIAEIQECFFE